MDDLETVTATQFSKAMGAILQRVLAGSRVAVTRYGVRIAILEGAQHADVNAIPVSSTDLFHNLGHYLDWLVAGDTFLITRHGRAIAYVHNLHD